MRICRAYKTELAPNDRQATLFRRHAGAARFVYNWALGDRIERYQSGEATNMFEQKRRFNALKHEQFPWLREAAYCAVEEAFRNLDRAYQNFFRRVKNGDAKKGFPKFKSRKHGLGAFTMRGSIHIEADRIKLPRIGWVRLKERGYIPTQDIKLLSANISERAGRWFVSVQCEQDIPDKVNNALIIGVDFGVKSLAVCSNGKTFDASAELYRLDRKMKRLSRQLSRRQKGGQNRNKSRQQIARTHARIANVRKQTIHQVTSYLTAKTKPSVIVIEDLNVKGMMSNHCLARAIGNVGFAEMRRQIEYKAAWRGIEVITADRFFPSSKTCSRCGVIRDELSLSERTFYCNECGFTIDRDLNAAISLRNLAVKRTVTACGEGKVADITSSVPLSEAGTEQADV